MKVSLKSYAKINLSLAITGVVDNFHMLDSLVCSIDLFDNIIVKSRKDKNVTVTMKGYGENLNLNMQNNNAYKAGIMFVENFDTLGVDIIIEKNIPIGSGLGGSSADISGVLLAMSKLYDINADLSILASKLGSDTVYMLTGGFARLTGKGDNVSKLNLKNDFYIVAILNEDGVDTKLCFKEYDKMQSKTTKTANKELIDQLIEKINNNDLVGIDKFMQNDLYVPAYKINQDIKKAYKELQSLSPRSVLMSGSGGTVYGIFDSKQLCEWACEKLKKQFDNVIVAKSKG